MKNILAILFVGFFAPVLSGQSYDEVFKEANRMRMYGNDSAFILIDQAIQIAGETKKEMYTRVVKGDFFNRFDSLDGGIAYLTNLIEQYNQELSPKQKAKSYCIMSGLYGRKNDFQQEIAMAQKGLQIAETTQDTQSLYTANFHLMMGFKNAENLKVSNRYGIQAFNLALHPKRMFSLHQVAFYLFSNNKAHLDEEPFGSYLYEYLKMTSPKELPEDGTHAGFEYLDQFKLSVKDWQGLYDKSLQDGLSSSRIRVGNKIGQILVDSGQYKTALEILNPVLDLANEEKSMLEVRYTLSLLQEAYEGLGDQSRALSTMKAFYQVRDSLQGIEVRKHADELNIKFETAQKDRTLAQQRIELLESQRQRNILLFSTLGLLVIGGLVFYVIKKRQQYQNDLAQKENQLKTQEIEQLKQKQKIVALDYMLMGEEKERARIAKDLHDSLGSILTSAKNQMQQVQNEIEALKDQDQFDEADGLIKQASIEVRRISHDMMPSALTGLGLQAAVEDLARQSEVPGKLSIKTHFFDLDETVWTNHQKVGVYRIIQELTQNVMKHAQATSLIIQLDQEGGRINLIVEDNGKGFEPEALKEHKGIGLKNIESRVESLDGHLDIQSKPGGPTTFSIDISLV